MRVADLAHCCRCSSVCASGSGAPPPLSSPTWSAGRAPAAALDAAAPGLNATASSTRRPRGAREGLAGRVARLGHSPRERRRPRGCPPLPSRRRRSLLVGSARHAADEPVAGGEGGGPRSRRGPRMHPPEPRARPLSPPQTLSRVPGRVRRGQGGVQALRADVGGAHRSHPRPPTRITPTDALDECGRRLEVRRRRQAGGPGVASGGALDVLQVRRAGPHGGGVPRSCLLRLRGAAT